MQPSLLLPPSAFRLGQVPSLPPPPNLAIVTIILTSDALCYNFMASKGRVHYLLILKFLVLSQIRGPSALCAAERNSQNVLT